jgi:hypothetical protein
LKPTFRLLSVQSCVVLWLVALNPLLPTASAQTDSQQTKTNQTSKVRFRPHTTTTAAVRVTGGSRGPDAKGIALDVLAPDDVGLTTQEQPSLFWFQSKPAEMKFELTLLEENQAKPLVQFTIERSAKAGIQRLPLADHGVKLVPGVEYQWVVALIHDPDNRSSDLVASGAIKRIAPSDELRGKVLAANLETLPAIYAEAGIWYDALTALSDRIEARPTDTTLREARVDLLRQVGLKIAEGS